MADDRRLDLDADDNLGVVNKDLLKDVMEATEHAKKRKADDKAQAAKQATQAKDRKTMTAIIAVATVVIIAFAYWLIVMRQAPQQDVQLNTQSRQQTAPVQQQIPPSQGQGNTGYVQQQPTQQTGQSSVVSDPVRPNPTDTYAEPGPQGNGGGM